MFHVDHYQLPFIVNLLILLLSAKLLGELAERLETVTPMLCHRKAVERRLRRPIAGAFGSATLSPCIWDAVSAPFFLGSGEIAYLFRECLPV